AGDNLTVSDGKCKFIYLVESYPGVIGNPKVLRDAAKVPGMEGVQRDAKVGIAMLHADQRRPHLNVNRQLLLNLTAQCLRQRLTRILLAAGKLPQAPQQPIEWALGDQETTIIAPDDAGCHIVV